MCCLQRPVDPESQFWDVGDGPSYAIATVQQVEWLEQVLRFVRANDSNPDSVCN